MDQNILFQELNDEELAMVVGGRHHAHHSKHSHHSSHKSGSGQQGNGTTIVIINSPGTVVVVQDGVPHRQ